MRLEGEAGAIEQLKAKTKDNKDYFKFLIGEARTNADSTTVFSGADGGEYVLRVDAANDVILVSTKKRD